MTPSRAYLHPDGLRRYNEAWAEASEGRARMGKSDFIGGRGEAIAYTRLTAICRRNDTPYFLPHYLGAKCPTFDFLVELVDAGRQTPFFFVQVKATRKWLTVTHVPPRLQVGVSGEDVRRMAAYPAPTYVVGVQEREERAFVISVHRGMSESISSMTTGHELNRVTLRRLWDEVRGFWRGRGMARERSAFANEVLP
jgi:hypothetical protein